MLLSVLMPVFNERNTVDRAIKRFLDTQFPCDVELVVVDDGSTDDSWKILEQYSDVQITLLRHGQNRGKGAAVRTAARHASGDYMIMYDADLEYNPEDIPKLLQPVVDGETEVVFGTRAFQSHTAYSFWYVLGNKAVAMFANVLFNSWVSDIETCFKLLPTSLFHDLSVKSTGFGMEAEITAKLLKRGIRPYEVPIHYRARSREQGKKLTWQDGVEALWLLTKIRFSQAL